MAVVSGDEIRQMFLLAAQARKLPETDPRRLEAEAILGQMEKRYLAENVAKPGSEPAEATPAWMEALQYVAALFAQMDAVDPAGADQRKAYWREISGGVSGWNKKPVEAKAKETEPEE